MSFDDSTNDVCLPSDFPDYDRSQSYNMAKAISLYFDSGFNWDKVLDTGLISKKTLYRYFKNPDFIRTLNNLLEPHKKIVLDKAINTYIQALDYADNWADKIKAADRLTAAYSPETFDPATRREIARTKGDLINKIAVIDLSSDKIRETISKDPFNKALNLPKPTKSINLTGTINPTGTILQETEKEPEISSKPTENE